MQKWEPNWQQCGHQNQKSRHETETEVLIVFSIISIRTTMEALSFRIVFNPLGEFTAWENLLSRAFLRLAICEQHFIVVLARTRNNHTMLPRFRFRPQLFDHKRQQLQGSDHRALLCILKDV